MNKHYGFKDEIFNYHNPNKCIKVSTDHAKPKIANEVHINFDNNNQEITTDESYFDDHGNINCYKYTEKLYNSF
ncbi:hypothetical protein M9Y10_030376 [Tritrichomonas musculus]|uniref:Uncharacterized protein n=1 Tax=Tritrichomonas musculus TaxID=1915356 RepID=A0ABR2H316_9EUKA